MRQIKYLNVILTVNAVVLTGLLWTQIAETPLLASSASAQLRSGGRPVPTIPNAAKQRDAINQSVRELRGSVEGLRYAIEHGVKVHVTNFEEVK